ncbi:MAG: hypothetical protein A4E32_01122 [Methanomassiliicoccales archaeon PtaU1.Bin124]|nr:MAG: hypothetical protein A4E32_01122 [Methanomassiliicoccales archaeon PtaU1.Bin124]
MMGKNIKAAIVLIAVFAIGLVGFYVFSAEMGDGLERTTSDEGIVESEPIYNAPLDYGSAYGSSLVMGIIGFVAVLLSFTAFWLLAKKRGQKSG